MNMTLMVAGLIYAVVMLSIITCVVISYIQQKRARDRLTAIEMRSRLHNAFGVWEEAVWRCRNTHPHLPAATDVFAMNHTVYHIVLHDSPEQDSYGVSSPSDPNLRVTVFTINPLVLVQDTKYKHESELPDKVRSNLLLLNMVTPERGLYSVYYIPGIGIRHFHLFWVFVD